MAESQSIDDVLNSIRRLVSEEVAEQTGKPVAEPTDPNLPADALILGSDRRIIEPEDPFQAIPSLAQVEQDARDAAAIFPDATSPVLTEDISKGSDDSLMDRWDVTPPPMADDYAEDTDFEAEIPPLTDGSDSPTPEAPPKAAPTALPDHALTDTLPIFAEDEDDQAQDDLVLDFIESLPDPLDQMPDRTDHAIAAVLARGLAENAAGGPREHAEPDRAPQQPPPTPDNHAKAQASTDDTRGDVTQPWVDNPFADTAGNATETKAETPTDAAVTPSAGAITSEASESEEQAEPVAEVSKPAEAKQVAGGATDAIDDVPGAVQAEQVASAPTSDARSDAPAWTPEAPRDDPHVEDFILSDPSDDETAEIAPAASGLTPTDDDALYTEDAAQDDPDLTAETPIEPEAAPVPDFVLVEEDPADATPTFEHRAAPSYMSMLDETDLLQTEEVPAEPSELETPEAEAEILSADAPDPIIEREDEDVDILSGGIGPDTAAPEIDTEALRELVAEVVRQELAGALGERITRNVRKLVRRELKTMFSGEDFD